MIYPPQHHQELEFENVVELVESCPLGMLLTADQHTPLCTHLPIIFTKDSENKILHGHMDRRNPQVEHILNKQTATLVFNGPETYISPTIYHSAQLPTWNYFKVHLYGRLIPVEEPSKIIDSLYELTAQMEPEKGYEFPKDHPRIDVLVPQIIGFEFHLDQWEGKYKISQDKHPKDRSAAKKQMIQQNPHQERLIETLYQKHRTKRI